MYAVIASGAKQARVEVGSRIDVELLKADVGETVNFTPVLIVNDETVIAEKGSLASAVVTGKVLGETKGPKIVGFTYKPKTRGRRHFGHRQRYTSVEITAIEA
jgi:large subunit ribosomal protein L21